MAKNTIQQAIDRIVNKAIQDIKDASAKFASLNVGGGGNTSPLKDDTPVVEIDDQGVIISRPALVALANMDAQTDAIVKKNKNGIPSDTPKGVVKENLGNVKLNTPLDPSKKYITTFVNNSDSTQAMTFEEYVVPTWKDITSTYATRVWTANDIGKKVKVYYIRGNEYVALCGLISANDTNLISQGNIFVFLGMERSEKDSGECYLVYYDTSNSRDDISFKNTKTGAGGTNPFIIKFEIEE